MEYLSPNGVRFDFSGWILDSPIQCFDRQDWVGCLHGCMLALTILNQPELTQREIADDGLLHELLHLSGGVDVCTHTTLQELRTQIAEIQTLCMAIKENNER